MTADLLIIVPTRGRPEAVARVAQAWHDTGAFRDGAALCFQHDADDSRRTEYDRELRDIRAGAGFQLRSLLQPEWLQLVPKLNSAARFYATHSPEFRYIGFAGDDHLPRTEGWVGRYRTALAELGTGIVYCDDGYQGEKVPTQWAMTADIVRALGGMVPGDMEHMYCDNAIRVLGLEADCITYLPDTLIEHMHPVAGKAEMDDGYSRVNAPAQYARDQRALARWLRYDAASDVAKIRALREVPGGE